MSFRNMLIKSHYIISVAIFLAALLAFNCQQQSNSEVNGVVQPESQKSSDLSLITSTILYGNAQGSKKAVQNSCRAVDPLSYGPCLALMGIAFNGEKCVGVSGCGCGSDCDFIYQTFDECRGNCYVCPTEEWINCMPVVNPESAKYCSGDYHDWIGLNCPDVNFAS